VNGILLVDKPEGTSSAGVIRMLKPRLHGAKVGHLGTLDPFASGLLPLCIGEATKVARYLLLEGKAYTGTIQLGTATDTLDRTGGVIETAPVPVLGADAVAEVAARYRGVSEQVPPMYSALKRDGVPLYKLARRGIEVERAPRRIEIGTLDLTPRGADALDFHVACTKGTYVRVLAADIGRALGTVAHLATLRRTVVGSFRVEDAVTPERLGESEAPLPLVPVREALAGRTEFQLPPESVARLRQGQQGALRDLPIASGPEAALVLASGGGVVGIIEPSSGGSWRLVRLLNEV
jgi:tRNA pseudouridine55 synthase